MRILWTLANWKRTGPVEPSLDLASALARRGHEVLVVTGRPVGTAPDEAGEAAEARGLTRLHLGQRLGKHRSWWSNGGDARLLAAHLASRKPDVIQATLGNDHRIAARAVALSGGGVPIARLWFETGDAPPPASELDLLRGAARVVAFSTAAGASLVAAGVSPEHVLRLPPALDAERLQRAATIPAAAIRTRHRVPPDHLLVGIVARVQTHRRFDLLWDAAARLRATGARFRLLVIGRGTKIDAVAKGPVDAAGIGDVVTFAGYLRGAEYASTLAALDAQVFLVPGSDPTCRALREGMALGVPSVATRRGMLPEIVDDGVTGLLVDETPDALAKALSSLHADLARRRRLGLAAAAKARDVFSLARASERLEGAYLSLR